MPVIRALIEKKPVFGICLGHQMLGLAVGAKTMKMHQGHHGANHPVKDLVTGKVEITSMNHGFAVDRATLPANAPRLTCRCSTAPIAASRSRTGRCFRYSTIPRPRPDRATVTCCSINSSSRCGPSNAREPDGRERSRLPIMKAQMNRDRIASWLAFWDGPHPIYVNARHKDVHYRLIAQAVAKLVPGPSAHVLDYGSGEALHADLVAAAADELVLCEGAPRVRAGIAARFAGMAKIRVLEPQDVAHLPAHSLDLIVLHSVAQYLTPDEAGALFALFRRLLKADGTLVVSDIIPPDGSAATDALALLRFGAANGFFVSALIGLVRTRLSDYWRFRTRLGLTRYDEATMIEKLRAAELTAERAATNIGHNQARMAFIARPN